MLFSSAIHRATAINKGGHQHWGAPGAIWLKSLQPEHVPRHQAHRDLVVAHKVRKGREERLLHYLGRHVPHPQKSLWSPDSPVQQDQHLFKLTTLDIDGFKYWFGVRRAMVDRGVMELCARASLLPPSWYGGDPSVPAPIYEKRDLYRYFLANRAQNPAVTRRAQYLSYANSMPKNEEDRQAERPRAPWM